MWPDHCIQETQGAEFHRDLIVKDTDIYIYKGVHSNVDAISAFGSSRENTGLLKELVSHDINSIYLVGLAFDFGLGYTAEDAIEEGFKTYIIKDATCSVDRDEEEYMQERLVKSGVNVIMQNQL